MIRRAGLEDRSRTMGRAPGPGATAAGDAVRRLVLRWGVDAAATVLSALAAASRSGQPFAVTTAVVRAYADLASSWHGLPREPGFAAVAAGLDYEGMRASLRAEGVGNGYPLFAALRPAIGSALREGFAATGPLGPSDGGRVAGEAVH